ncbi:unnamed protein product [Brachionus calyciflorus]|uniref:Uncharacterized protein n=1 Tax=Brachionus calyciflorus TaxID=104777 RepID=A0A814H2J8_9BILA|nr:unnamed protein product [Brachionus calyciflorus]
MSISTVSYSKYILTGSLMLIMCIFLMIIYVNSLKSLVDNASNYSKDSCTVNNITQTKTFFDCWVSGAVTVVEIPCLKILVNTSNASNVFFYRNVNDKMFMQTNNLECSYVPSACQNDAIFLERELKKTLIEMFPPVGIEFSCNVNDFFNPSNALLYLPDPSIYYFSLGVISTGIALSVSLIVYGWLHVNIILIKKRFGFLNELISKPEEDAFLTYVKKVLTEAHINADDLSIMNDIDYDSIDNELRQPVKNPSFSSFLRVRTPSARNSSVSIASFNQKPSDIKPIASKIKLGTNEICIGRIEYRAPSVTRLSRQNSIRSYYSTTSNSSDRSDRPQFYLNHGESNNLINREEELDIPDVIMEEDERYLSIHKKPSNSKFLPISNLFSLSSDEETKEVDDNINENKQ